MATNSTEPGKEAVTLMFNAVVSLLAVSSSAFAVALLFGAFKTISSQPDTLADAVQPLPDSINNYPSIDHESIPLICAPEVPAAVGSKGNCCVPYFGSKKSAKTKPTKGDRPGLIGRILKRYTGSKAVLVMNATVPPTTSEEAAFRLDNASTLSQKNLDTVVSCWEKVGDKIKSQHQWLIAVEGNVGAIVNYRDVLRYFIAEEWADTYNGKRFEDAVLNTLLWKAKYHVLHSDVLRPLSAQTTIPLHIRDSLVALTDSGLCYLSLFPDIQHRPIAYFRVQHFTMATDLETCTTQVAWTVERALRASEAVGAAGFVAIVDLHGLTWDNSPPIQMVKDIVIILRDHFPACVDRIYLVNVSATCGMMWQLIVPLLSKRIVNKLVVLTERHTKTCLCADLGAECLETEYGGHIAQHHSIMH